MTTESFRRDLERAKRDSTAQILFKSARLLNESAIAILRRRTGESRLRATHTVLFPHIDLEGTRLTELAARVGISKQAVGQLVEEMVGMGFLERVPDPRDGRAKLVRFSEEWRLGLFAGLAFLGELETRLTERLGPSRMKAFHESLTLLLDMLEHDPSLFEGL